MAQDWELDEKDEQIGQAALLLKKLLDTPDDCALRDVCENWIEEHKNYLPDEPMGYDVSALDGDEKRLNF
jgi:hypothetical protein